MILADYVMSFYIQLDQIQLDQIALALICGDARMAAFEHAGNEAEIKQRR